MYPALEESRRRITVRQRSPNAEFLGHNPNRGISEEKFAKIAAQFPTYLAGKTRIEMMLPMDHPDLNLLLEKAKELSLHIESDRARKSQVEIMDYSKCAESEIRGAAFLECLVRSPNFDECVDLNDGKIIAFREKVAKSAAQEFGSLTNLPHLIFVRGLAKSQLENADLVGLELEQVSIGEGCSWPRKMEPLYLVRSSVTMPTSNLLVFDDDGNTQASSECDWDSNSTRWYPLDGYEVSPLLKYSGNLPKVDVASSKEVFGGESEGYRRIIYSQKAKSVLEEIGMKLECVPVRVEVR